MTLDEDDEEHEGDHTADADDESLTDSTDNPTNLFSSATGQQCSHSLPFSRILTTANLI